MGLDMYLTGRKHFWGDYNNLDNDPHEDGYRISSMTLDLGYWRKHQDLHDYIVREFAHGVDDCQEIDLRQEDLVNLIAVINKRELPKSRRAVRFMKEDEQIGKDLGILTMALLWLQVKESGADRNVCYRASW